MEYTSDVAFTPSVKRIQSERGSRRSYARLEASGGFADAITPDVQAFIEACRTSYLATASADGQPYVQHRGGGAGFLRVLDPHTIGFADLGGNKQYISTGNLAENDRALLFLMDYEEQMRVKIWGHAEIVRDDEALLARLIVPGYGARVEQAIVFHVSAWDANCPQHIPRLIDADAADAERDALRARIALLEGELRMRGIDPDTRPTFA